MSTGKPVAQDEELSQKQNCWISHLRVQITKYPINETRTLLGRGHSIDVSTMPMDEALMRQCFSLLSYLAEFILMEHHISIDKAIQLLCEPNRNILQANAKKQPMLNRARSFVFYCTSLITMLYSAKYSTEVDHLRLDHTQCLSIVDTLASDLAERPLCEFLQDFGPLLPAKDDHVIVNTPDPVFASDSLYVSLLNAETLTQLGDIEIEWIDNISSHLEFDPERRRLLLFRLPSFCEIHHYEETILSK